MNMPCAVQLDLNRYLDRIDKDQNEDIAIETRASQLVRDGAAGAWFKHTVVDGNFGADLDLDRFGALLTLITMTSGRERESHSVDLARWIESQPYIQQLAARSVSREQELS